MSKHSKRETFGGFRWIVPEISRFLGIVIKMFYRGHEPAHFHAVYGEHRIVVYLRAGVVEGHFPRRSLGHILEWYQLHRAALEEDWQLAAQRKPLKLIPPLE